MNEFCTAQVIDLQQAQGEALERLLWEAADKAARAQYGCVVVAQRAREVRDFWNVPGDLYGQQVVVCRWEIRRLPPDPGERLQAWRIGRQAIVGHEARA
ncbi:MAG: hypothetical protein HGA45_07275 [Chloroflexales bacterium]|nr:hypothetical protein [Chloroflexales bacterium]